ncbi:lipopolysaccharide biosynthesis protein [Actinokineospora enzanensis]|uniref:lipopolysaccharide biosynthesis protein n=1 Tax=Actinokineospora enzanensis TaxID=155975 RepID=UPI0012EC6492|nr:hypothetical protein [Actinokineospora enzanensis]
MTAGEAGAQAAPAVPDTAGVGRSVSRITIAIIAAAVLSYAVIIVTGRLLTKADYAVFMTFWGLLFGLGSAMSPLEQELSRQAAHARLRGTKVGADGVTALLVGLGAVGLVALVPLIPVVNDRLFPNFYWLAAVVLVGGLGFAVQFAVRGMLVGSDQVNPYAGVLLVEAGIRPLLILALALAALDGQITLAIAVAFGSFAWLVFVRPARAHLDPALPGDPPRLVVRRMLMLFASAACIATVVTGYPAVIGVLAPGGDPERMAEFLAALAVSRVPLVLFSAVQALAVPVVVRLSQTTDGQRRLRRLLALGSAGAVTLAGVGALIGWLIGPWVVALLFGSTYVVPDWVVAGLVWSAVLLAAVQLLASVLLARVRPGRVLAVWGTAAVCTALALVLWPGDTVAKATFGMVVGPTLGLIVGMVLTAKSDPVDISAAPAR